VLCQRRRLQAQLEGFGQGRCGTAILTLAGPYPLPSPHNPCSNWALCNVVLDLLLQPHLPLTPSPSPHECSNWALCNMVLALLLEQQKASLPVSNAGHLLLGFLKYYGRVFELEASFGVLIAFCICFFCPTPATCCWASSSTTAVCLSWRQVDYAAFDFCLGSAALDWI